MAKHIRKIESSPSVNKTNPMKQAGIKSGGLGGRVSQPTTTPVKKKSNP